MTIELNGEKTEVPDGVVLGLLLSQLGAGGRGSAAVVDGEVVPRSLWPEHVLTDGAAIEIVTAVQGG